MALSRHERAKRKIDLNPLEMIEKLEQLRVLGSGAAIRVGLVAHAHRGVDTPADYAEFVRAYRDGGTRRAA